jgi:hypothetical protein
VKLFDLFRKKKAPPIIMTEYGPTTEAYRFQAMVNMVKDPELKKRVLALLVEQTGSLAAAELEFQRRYPEMEE